MMESSTSAVQEIVVDAPPRRVTAMEDRAQVERRAQLHLPAGRHVLRVEGVCPVVVDRTLRASVNPLTPSGDTPGVALVDVGITRDSTLEATRPELQRELQDKLRDLERDYGTRRHEHAIARAQVDALTHARTQLLEHIARQAGRGIASPQPWGEGLARLDDELGGAETEVRRLEHDASELQRRIEKLGDRLWLALQPTVSYRATLRAVVEVERAAEYRVGWEYLVPCALWRPSHRAELDAQGALSWTTLGTVWQNTGEDWQQVELRLSTERPTLGATLPLLEEDALTLRPKSAEEQRSVTVSSRDDTIAEVVPGLDDDGRAASALPGVDDGGQVRTFEVSHAVDIPSDGRAHRVQIDRFTTEAARDLVCMPELVGAVMLRTQQQNGGPQPLLAGPVELVREGGFTGRGQIGFVAPGERFPLGWGSVDELSVSRRAGLHEDDAGIIRKAARRHWCKVYLSNTGEQPRAVKLTERIPVSEVEQVHVELDSKHTTAGYRTDDNGHVVWELELAPGTQREIALAFEVESDRKVVWR